MSLAVPYLALADYKLRSVVDEATIDGIERKRPGKIAALIAQAQAWIDARLRKRYIAPFLITTQTPTIPEIVLKWLTELVDLEVYRTRGMQATNDDMLGQYEKTADRARAEVLEAADSKDGLFDLPVRDDNPGSAIVAPKPDGCSDASPYHWMDRQRCRGRRQDDFGRGGGGGTFGSGVPF